MPDSRDPATPAAEGLGGLRADCSRCFALCCVVPAFAASSDFAITKPAGHACPNLQQDDRCGIHARLRESGFRGCTVYDCFGAGQKVSQETFEGQDWRGSPQTARRMFAVFPIVRDLHELLWYLTQALVLVPGGLLRAELEGALATARSLADADPEALLALDVGEHRRAVNALLVRASETARAAHRRTAKDYRGADLVGTNLRGADLRGATLRGALLIGADLSGADLNSADLTGADLRGTHLGGADLGAAMFLTQSQLDAATGDAGTRLPTGFTRPAHW